MNEKPKDHGIDGRVDLPIYPKAFIEAAKFNREKGRVFVAMPFEAPHSDQLWQIIESICHIHGMNVRRGDSATYPNPIVSNILEELERAEIIVADLTGLNPNVLYEVGISHVRCSSVILLSPKRQTVPFNLSAIRCVIYDDITTDEGRIEFANRLGDTFIALKRTDYPIVIESPIERTKILLHDLESLSSLPNDKIRKENVRFSGFLSSLAISYEEPFNPEEDEYQKLLLREKDALLSIASRGCLVRCIISPPTPNNWKPYKLKIVEARLKHLIELLTSDDDQNAIEWAISPFSQKNLYIIGNISCSEGYKKGYQRGFGLTSRQTGYASIRSAKILYDSLFEWLVTDTLSNYSRPENGRSENSERVKILKIAAVRSLEQSLRYCQKLQK